MPKNPAKSPQEWAAMAQEIVDVLPIDQVKGRDRRIKGPYLTGDEESAIVWLHESRPLWARAGSSSDVGSENAPNMQFGKVQDDKSVPLIPAREGAANSIPVDYTDGMRTNFVKLFTYLGITIPKGKRIAIPVEYVDHPEYGPCVMLLRAKAKFERVGKAKKA